jgi:hypothetical protein
VLLYRYLKEVATNPGLPLRFCNGYGSDGIGVQSIRARKSALIFVETRWILVA